jgi:hypothetical protein
MSVVKFLELGPIYFTYIGYVLAQMRNSVNWVKDVRYLITMAQKYLLKRTSFDLRWSHEHI